MLSLSRFQLNAILRAGLLATAVTVASLGYIGGNVSSATDSTFGFLHNNALLDTRGFTALNDGSALTTLDANGLPTGACTLCFDTTPSSTSPGPLPPGNYFLNVPSAGQTTTAIVNGGFATLGTGVALGDGITIRYPLTVTSSGTGTGTTASINFSGPLSGFPDLARDGSTSTSGQPLFCTAALAHYSQFTTLRLMDFLLTNARTDTTWSTRPPNWLMHVHGQPYSWEKMVAFINALAAYPGSKLQNVFINIPGFADIAYVSSLATALNTLGLTSAVKVHIQRANEHWNTAPGFPFYGAYQASAMAELNCISNYGITTPVISSVVTDGTKATFTTINPVSTYFSGTASCVVVGGSFGFSVGTLASPVTATATGPNTFTVPTTATWNSSGNGGVGGYEGVIFNLASTLIADGILPDVFHTGAKWYTRLSFQDQQAWSAIRPQDRWFIETALYGTQGPNGAGGIPIEHAYAVYLGGGSAASWLYGAAIGLYVTATSASTTLNALFTQLNTLLSTTTDGQIRAHVYVCKRLGIHPLVYEGGADLQNVPSLITAANTDARMGAFTTAVHTAWFSNGGEIFNDYHVTPTAFTNTSQGGWSALQTYADTASPKLVALLAYGSTPISYANVYGSPGTIDIPTFYQFAASGSVINGLFGWFSAGNYVDVEVAIPVAGTYTLTLTGCSKFANVVTFSLDPTYSTNGTPIGTSTLVATGGGWNVDSASAAVPVANPITVSLSAGIHTIRLSAAAISTNGAALKSIAIT